MENFLGFPAFNQSRRRPRPISIGEMGLGVEEERGRRLERGPGCDGKVLCCENYIYPWRIAGVEGHGNGVGQKVLFLVVVGILIIIFDNMLMVRLSIVLALESFPFHLDLFHLYSSVFVMAATGKMPPFCNSLQYAENTNGMA